MACAPTPPESTPVSEVEPHTVPVFGGTLASSGNLVAVADPGLGRIWQIDARGPAIESETQLEPTALPFRLAFDDNQLYATLRRSGEVIALSVPDGSEVARAWVCAEPRGVATSDDGVYVACASGELVRFGATLDELDRWWIDRDLRDVVVTEDGVWVSRLKSAEVLQLDPLEQRVVSRNRPPAPDGTTAQVGWRLRPATGPGVVLLHQLATLADVPLAAPGGIVWDQGRLCPEDPMIQTRLTWFADGVEPQMSELIAGGVLPVDIATDLDDRFDFALPGSAGTATVLLSAPRPADLDCVFVAPLSFGPGVVTSVERTPAGLVAFTRDPPMLRVGRERLALDGAFYVNVDILPLGRFHLDPGAGFACASCHPEGNEDGHTWRFEGLGARRTMSLGGGLSDRAPFHWDGEFPDMHGLLHDVFHERMGGDELGVEASQALVTWLDDLPALQPGPLAPQPLVDAGRALFHDPSVGCSSCHTGEQLTDQQLYDVGTSTMPLRTASLVGVGYRTPFMHDGCAAELAERFTNPDCGGGDAHGHTSDLTAEGVEALVAYLNTL